MQPFDEQRRVEPRPCEDCGSQVVSGLEPFDYDEDHPDQVLTDYRYERSDWCINLDCLSNRCLSGVVRVGVSHYVCVECGDMLHAPVRLMKAHVRRHGVNPTSPGSTRTPERTHLPHQVRE